MSASDTQIEKQKRNHRPSLLGIAIAVVAVVLVLIGISVFGNDTVEDEASSGELTTGATVISE
jgi:hypothetical protein